MREAQAETRLQEEQTVPVELVQEILMGHAKQDLNAVAKTWEAAKAFLDVLGLSNESSKPDLSSLDTRQLVKQFVASKKGSVAEVTLTTYRNWVAAFANKYPVLPLTPEPIEQYLAGMSRTSGHAVYGGLKLFYEFLEQRRGLPNPIAKVKRPRFKPKEPDSLSLEEAKLFFQAAETDREKAVAHLCLGHGFRKAEVLRLDIRDVGEDWIRVQGKERIQKIPLLLETREVLMRIAGKRPHSKPLFASQQGKRLSPDMCDRVVKKLFRKAGIANKRQSCHVLRYSFATLAREAGCDTHSVERLMRHSVRNDMTDRYIHPSEDSLKKKLQRYSPLRLVNGDVAKFGLIG